jgi:uncharacterized protein
MTIQIERRGLAVAELRRAKPESRTIEGYAALFDTLSEDLGWFREKIANGAFAESLKRGDDVRALFNHDRNVVLGRSAAGTLRMQEDERGLRIEVDAPDTQAARDLMTSMERGDITQMSFGFITERQEWDERTSPITRTLLQVRLLDVSIVTEPAYPQTAASVRSRDDAIAAGLLKPPSAPRLPHLQLRQRLAQIPR